MTDETLHLDPLLDRAGDKNGLRIFTSKVLLILRAFIVD
jgi:hypothetical protein